jgi:hypothetical protein
MVVQVSTMSSKTGFRLSPKNWPVYYQPSGVQAPRVLQVRSLRLEA